MKKLLTLLLFSTITSCSSDSESITPDVIEPQKSYSHNLAELELLDLINMYRFDNNLNTNKYTTQKLADIQTMSKEEFIKEYGDPFQESLNLLDIPDSEFVTTLDEAEAEELRLYEEKMFGKTK